MGTDIKMGTTPTKLRNCTTAGRKKNEPLNHFDNPT